MYGALNLYKRGREYKIRSNLIQSSSLRNLQENRDPAIFISTSTSLQAPWKELYALPSPPAEQWLVICGLMTKDTLGHLVNTPPVTWTSFSGFLFFAIKQKKTLQSYVIIQDNLMISALCRMNVEWNERGNFDRELWRRRGLLWAKMMELSFLGELRAESHL